MKILLCTSSENSFICWSLSSWLKVGVVLDEDGGFRMRSLREIPWSDPPTIHNAESDSHL